MRGDRLISIVVPGAIDRQSTHREALKTVLRKRRFTHQPLSGLKWPSFALQKGVAIDSAMAICFWCSDPKKFRVIPLGMGTLLAESELFRDRTCCALN
jgi:hypothetical protein